MRQASPNGRTCSTGVPNICYCALQALHGAWPAPNTPSTLREPSESVRYTSFPGGDRRLLKTTGGLGTGIGGERVLPVVPGTAHNFPHTQSITSHHPWPATLAFSYSTKILFTKRTIRDRFCTHVVRAWNTNPDSKKKKKKKSEF